MSMIPIDYKAAEVLNDLFLGWYKFQYNQMTRILFTGFSIVGQIVFIRYPAYKVIANK